MRILVTRYGGVGDLLYIEPTIRALSEKYGTKDIVLRTYKDYVDVLKSHPCISGIVLDSNKYELGYFRNNQPKNHKMWGCVNPNFDLHVDFSGSMERIPGAPNHHAIDMFAFKAGISLTDKKPIVFFNKVPVPKVKLLAQLKSDGQDRNLSENKALRELIESHASSAFIGEARTTYDEFMSRIAECETFIGTESCGVIAAHAMGKKAIGIYKNAERIESRSFNGVICLTQEDIPKRIEDIKKEIYKKENEMQETSKAFEYRKRKGHFDKFLHGHGIDIGCGDDKLVVVDGEVDGWDVSNGDAMLMAGIPNEKYDFVYSSHCLEHMVDVGVSLYNWTRILKAGGHLYVVVPDFVLYEKMKFPSMWNHDHKSTFSDTFKRDKVKRENHYHLDDIKSILAGLNMDVLVATLEDEGYNYDTGPEIDQTMCGAMSQLLIVARKTKATPTSQMGADDWVLSNHKKGFFVDAGCFDGEDLSNTYKLEKHGWKGICIDAHPKNFSTRPMSKVVQAVLGGSKDEDVTFVVSKCPEISGVHKHLSRTNWENWVEKTEIRKTSLLSDILEENNAPPFIEYLNMDIEGAELDVLRSFPYEKYKFGCISIEHNYDEPKRTLIRNVLKRKGYKLYDQVKADDWFTYDGECVVADIVVVATSQGDQSSKMTRECVESILASEPDSQKCMSITVVEPNPTINHNGISSLATILYSNAGSDFGSCCNLGRSQGNAQWVIFVDHHARFTSGWLSGLMESAAEDNLTLSFSPTRGCPEEKSVIIGTKERPLVDMLCIAQKRCIYDKIGSMPEFVSPDSYHKCLSDAGVRHGMATKSKIGEAEKTESPQETKDECKFQEIKKDYKIGLCMIVKNEGKIIRRCLDSVKPMIDYVCITDTGSTDNTVEIINQWMKENSIDGFVCFEPWKDFAHNRSIALQKIRACSNVEYALMIDADEILKYDSWFDAAKEKKGMDKDLYNITCHYGSIVYARTSITKNKKPYFYKGVVHEFLDCAEPIVTRGTINGVYNVPLQDSARNGTKKFEHDVEVLENALLTEKDPFMISRYTFYLAQSHRDLGNHAKSLKLYLDRSSQGFWHEEIFISLLQAARTKEHLQYPDDDIIQTYMRAHEVAPYRIEALHGAARFCRTHSRNHQAYILSKWGQGLPARKDGLFVESWIWDYGIDDEVSISSYWAGHYEDGIKVTKELLKKIPEPQRPRVQRNLEYLEGKVKK